ncbi:MAG: glycerol-3-phosphate 1-O-acyltransferase PlsY [Clostridiales Family XIII bacterium]|nr:glycerol-3-phosphate 1-O-acyltransferase PlsY [Clostridiales Family XIII bacterium]
MEELAAIDSSVVILLFYIAAAYFAGSFSPSIMLGKLNGIDIRTKGSGNAGTTNVLRTLGKKAAAITLAVDVCKGFAAVFLAKMLFGAAFALLCGIAVICGHIWPAVHGFRGGKGVATGLGVLLAFNAVIGGLALAVAAAVMLVTKRVSVGALTAAAAFPAMVFWMEPVYFAPALAIAVVVWIKHRQNLVRLVRGEEPKIRFKP